MIKDKPEYQRLYRDHALVMLYPQHYPHDPKDDTYSAHDDKHEWHRGAPVRRLIELNEKRKIEEEAMQLLQQTKPQTPFKNILVGDRFFNYAGIFYRKTSDTQAMVLEAESGYQYGDTCDIGPYEPVEAVDA